MKKQLLIGMMVLVLSFANSGTAFAASGSIQEWAYQDAEQAVISGHLVGEDEVKSRGPEYANAFLTAFATVSRAYEEHYRQGVDDGFHGWTAALKNGTSVAEVAYQRGYDRGNKLRLVGNPEAKSPRPSTNDQQQPATTDEPGVTDSKVDDQEYPAQDPTPDQAKFISRIAKSAQKVGMEYDLYPSVIIAQAALESNWGASNLARKPYHNLFGVKGNYNGRSVRQPTIEYTEEGKAIKIHDFFRWYDNDYQSLCDYAETLNDPLYADVHRGQAASFREATHALLGKYATDPRYDRKLNRVIQTYQLTKYDHQLPKKTVGKQQVKNPPITETVAQNKQTSTPTKHRVTLLSVVGGVGSAGALGLLRRFALK